MNFLSSLKWIIFAIAAAIVFRIFFVSVFKVPTVTMAPTLLPGDFILTNQIAYGLKLPWMESGFFSSDPDVGDVVVFKIPQRPGTHFVKRVVARAGDTIEIKNGNLIINQQPCTYINSDNKNFDLNSYSIFTEKCGASLRNVMKSTQPELALKDVPAETLKENQFYVLGDNRDTSEDSRDWGPIDRQQINSQVKLIWLSIGSSQNSISTEKGLRTSRLMTFVK